MKSRLCAARLLLLAFVAAVLLTGVAPSAQNATAKGRPNVLFIAVDDLNDWVGALNAYPGVKTPNLDRLAKRGVLFTRAYCAAPSCNPSRTALLTGVRPSTSGVYENDNPWRPVLPGAVTLPQHFLANGYDVIGSGKIFHNAYNDPKSWHAFRGPGNSPTPAKKPANGLKRGHFDWAPLPSARDEDMGDYQVVSWALDRWNEKRDKPLFLAVGMTRPHLPWYVPQAYFDKYPLDKITLPTVKEGDLNDIPAEGKRLALRSGDHKAVTQSGQWKQAVQAYLASISFMDAQIGRLLNAVEKSPQGRNTIIVLWGDHGWNLGEKQHWRKFALWEDTTRVPLMMVVPGVTRPGQTCARTVNLMDLYPTLVALCGLPTRPGLEAQNIAPLLQNPAGAWDHPSLTTYLRGNHAVRSERWRYIRYHDGGEELYDHQTDPREWTNLAADPKYADVKKDLARYLPKKDAPTAPQQTNGGRD